MLTYEFDIDIGRELYDFLRTKMSEIVKRAIQDNTLRVIFSKNALDILPNLNKGDAVSFLINKYGIDKKDVLAIGDSSHSDLSLLQSAGLVACPDNADNEMKKYVLEHNGFVVPNSSNKGLLNILDLIENFVRFSTMNIDNTNAESLNKFRDKKILVIGDYCIDKFCYGEPKGISPEAPILRIVGSKESIKINPGMTGNIAAGVRALGAECYAIGIIGEDEASRNLIKIFNERGISTQGMISRNYRITPEFTRIVATGKYPEQQKIRFDIENTKKLDESATHQLIEYIDKCRGIDAIIVADYNEFGEGIINQELLEKIKLITMREGIILIGDSRLGFSNFTNFTCIKPNIYEAEQIFHEKTDSLEELAQKIIQNLNLKSVLITKDKDGMYLFTSSGIKKDFPAYAKKVVDVTGAGDSVISAFTLALASGFSYENSAKLASYAAAIAVSKPGVDVVTLNELKQFVLENEK